MKTGFHKEVDIPAGKVILKGELIIPIESNAIIVFSHGSGSSRFSKRNQQVAGYLREKNFGTLLFDLLTEEEDQFYNNRFNIDLLSKRLVSTTEWLEKYEAARGKVIGFFGASTGAASALQAAAELSKIGAVVSRGGRPDLAQDLQNVKVPTLLIVGGLDTEVILLNQDTFQKLHCIKELTIVAGASHLFEEEGKMDQVSKLAAAWFEKYLQPGNV